MRTFELPEFWFVDILQTFSCPVICEQLEGLAMVTTELGHIIVQVGILFPVYILLKNANAGTKTTYNYWGCRQRKDKINKQQAGAELCQGQFKLGLAKQVVATQLDMPSSNPARLLC